MKNSLNAIIFGLAIVLAAFFLGKAYVNRNVKEGKIQVTGLGKADFVSDLIVWEGNFNVLNKDLQMAYADLNRNKSIIKEYLKEKGVASGDIVFNAVNVDKATKSKYSYEGKYMGDEFIGYKLTQSFKIESMEVEKIEGVSREITELLKRGLQLYSESPRYYYTKLSDLKIEMISKATEDAKVRAENIAKYSGGELGQLESAKMGIFQITGQNSNEDYSWGGTFNTRDKKKTASITMKLVYKTK